MQNRTSSKRSKSNRNMWHVPIGVKNRERYKL
jgi:hypothetical protein